MKSYREKKLYLYWFSGSGNTLAVSEAFAKRLRELGWTVELRPLERFDPAQLDSNAVFAIAFPTHCFSIPEIVWRFIHALPQQTNPTPAIMLGTHGALSGGVCGPMKRLLTAKGFRCDFGRIFLMPDSFFPYTGEKANQRIRNLAFRQVEHYAEKFDAGQTRWPRWPILADVCGWICGTFFALRKYCKIFHTTIHANKTQCTRCGICVTHCPTNALEQKTPEEIPIANLRCTNCLRCVAVCPANAMKHCLGFHSYRNEPAEQLHAKFPR